MKSLVGRTIVKVELNRRTVEGIQMTDPTIWLDDGTSLRFLAEESPDGGEYGIAMVRRRAPKMKKGAKT